MVAQKTQAETGALYDGGICLVVNSLSQGKHLTMNHPCFFKNVVLLSYPLYFFHNIVISRQKKIPRAVGALGIHVVETTELESVTSCV